MSQHWVVMRDGANYSECAISSPSGKWGYKETRHVFPSEATAATALRKSSDPDGGTLCRLHQMLTAQESVVAAFAQGLNGMSSAICRARYLGAAGERALQYRIESGAGKVTLYCGETVIAVWEPEKEDGLCVGPGEPTGGAGDSR